MWAENSRAVGEEGRGLKEIGIWGLGGQGGLGLDNLVGSGGILQDGKCKNRSKSVAWGGW